MKLLKEKDVNKLIDVTKRPDCPGHIAAIFDEQRKPIQMRVRIQVFQVTLESI